MLLGLCATTTASHAFSPKPALSARWKYWAIALVLSCVVIYPPASSYAAGLDCPEIGPGPVPNLFVDLQAKLVTPGNGVDLANEINNAINWLQTERPGISSAELTNVIIAAYCPAIANTTGLSASEKWQRIRQLDRVLQQQLAANMQAPGTLIIANVPLAPAVYRELRSQAVKGNLSPAQLMAAILTRAAGN